MSKNKIAAFIGAVCLMSLADCGGIASSDSNGAASSVASAGSVASASSTIVATSSVAAVKSIEIEALTLSAEGGIAKLVLTGTMANFSAVEAKFALAIQEITPGNTIEPGDFIAGSATPADTDYKYVPVIADGAFTVTFNLTELVGLVDGFYHIYTGPKGFFDKIGAISQASRIKAGDYAYYVRQDEQVDERSTLVLDKLPPIALEEASVFKHTDDHIYAKVGGTKKAEITLAYLDEVTPFINLQQVGGNWGNTRINTYFFTVDGDKAYINFDINFVVSGRNYNTHLNILENKTADAKMDNAFDDRYVYNEKLINVYCNPDASASDSAEFWGNLAFKVSAAPEGAEEGKQPAA
ncbi:MAG: hypothetical protein GX813_01230 [Erysipelotrichia bacterium]|nr:hypothetical protein [Erysipelotrichia bacterium]